MFKYKEVILIFLMFFFLLFSFYPTIFELTKAGKLADLRREFILEHNYYWPDFNLYLSKIRQGFKGSLTALERYTSEPHKGSLIQEFYVVLGLIGKTLNINPNFSYQLGRVILSPLLLLVIILLVSFYFRSPAWQVLAFIIILISGSFPRFYTDVQGTLRIGRYMEWWSNIDAVQRITFIPHILFGQVISFFILYQLTTCNLQLTTRKLILLIFLGNAVGLVFPPSLITLNSVIALIIFIKNINFVKDTLILSAGGTREEKFCGEASFSSTPTCLQKNSCRPQQNYLSGRLARRSFSVGGTRKLKYNCLIGLLFLLFTFPSLLYIFFTTRQLPWSALVVFHRTHPMMIPFWEYILGTGPIFFLGLAGAIVSIIKRDRKFQPLIFWILTTSAFAILFTHLKEQSPLRFTQTGLFIPLGILGAYFFQVVWESMNQNTLALSAGDASGGPPTKAQRPFERAFGGGDKRQDPQIKIGKVLFICFILLYILENLYMMKTSLSWQTTFITQRVNASHPLVPYPPQTMYPLKEWMDGIRWLRDNTNRNDVVLAEITAGNHIPAYSGNTVYFGQSNTVDYERKQLEIWKFFKGEMTESQAQLFLQNGGIKYIFFSVQEKEKAGGKPLQDFYPFLTPVFENPTTSIFSIFSHTLKGDTFKG